MPVQIPGRFERRRRGTWAPRTMAMADAPMVVAFAIVAFTAASCSDATAPASKPLAVAVIVDQVPGPVTSVGADGLPLITCDASLRATATGTGQASWSDATIRWFAGVDDAPAFDSAVVSSSEVQAAWGSPEIAGGQSQESRWTLSAPVPFRAVFESHYQVEGGDTKAVSATIACGPDIPVGTPPPSVTALAIHTAAGDLEPGDTMSVNYTASSAVGLWQTTVALTGPCELHQLFLDSLRTSVTRTVRFKIPAECKLGLPITATVLLKGAGLQTGSRTLSTGIALVDKTPPTIRSLAFPIVSDPGFPILHTDYFTGDSIVGTVSLSDNRALQALVWELQPAGIRDSIMLPGALTDSPITVKLPPIPIPPGVTGPVQLHFYARDAVGLTSDTIVASRDGPALVHPTVERPIATATIPGVIQDVAIDPRGGVAYLLQPNEQRIAVLSLSALTITASIALPSAPGAMDLSPSGDSLIVLLPAQRALGIIDLRQSPPKPSIVPVASFNPLFPADLAKMRMAANGKVLIAAYTTVVDVRRLLEVDLATGEERIRTDAGDGTDANGGFIFTTGGEIARSSDASVLVLIGTPRYMRRYDAGSDNLGPLLRLKTGTIGGASFDATNHVALIGLGVYDGSLQYLRDVHSPQFFLPPTVLAPAGDLVYEGAAFEGLVRAGVDDGMILDRTPLPFVPALVRITPDGATVVVVEATHSATPRIATIAVR